MVFLKSLLWVWVFFTCGGLLLIIITGLRIYLFEKQPIPHIPQEEKKNNDCRFTCSGNSRSSCMEFSDYVSIGSATE